VSKDVSLSAGATRIPSLSVTPADFFALVPQIFVDEFDLVGLKIRKFSLPISLPKWCRKRPIGADFSAPAPT
jgi:hypothetical protein